MARYNDDSDLSKLLQDPHADPTATPMSGEASVRYRPAPIEERMREYPITFGQQYGSALYGSEPHPALGIYSARDGYLIVEAQSRAEARERAFRVIGEAWAFDYDKVEDLDPEGNGWYPRGEIARIRWDETLVVHEHEEN